MKQIQFKIAIPGARLPTRSTPHSAGLDLYPLHAMELPAGRWVLVDTGIAIADCPSNVQHEIRPRSRAARQGIECFHGTVDADYRYDPDAPGLGTLKVALRHAGPGFLKVSQAEAIAQLVTTPVVYLDPVESDEVTATERGGQGGINQGEPA